MATTEELLNKIGKKIVKLTKEQLIKQDLKNSNLIKNITYEVDEMNGEFELIVRTPNYGIFVDKGRGKNKRMPPSKPIEEWMKSKQIPLRYSFPIRRKIGKDGISARPFLHVIVKNINDIEDILFDFEEDKIAKELENIFKELKK